MPHLPRMRIALIGALVTLLILPAGAAADTLGSEAGQGRALAQSVRSGEMQCSELTADDFELVGEYAMSRYLGDEGAHEAMNERMTEMMGEAGERQMHIALGYRYAGCSGGPNVGCFGPMAGMMGGGSGYRQGMMGEGNYEGRGGYFGMMGFDRGGDSDVSVVAVVLIALAAAALGAGATALVMRRQGGRG